jgi:hypothetical protein
MKEFKPGYAFKNNKYYIFDKYGVTVYRGWPDMLAYRKTKTKPWRSFRPKFTFDLNSVNIEKCYICELQKLENEKSEHTCKPFPKDSWLNLIPKEILKAIEPFKQRQWHLLSFVARCGLPSMDLIKSTPALAWMLASSWAFKTNPVKNHFRSIRRLLVKSKNQQDILKWLDYPNTKSVIKILRKIDIAEVDVSLLLNLKDLLIKQVSIRHLQHCNTINKTTLWLLKLSDQNKLKLSSNFIEHVSSIMSKDSRFEISSTLEDVIKMNDALCNKQISVQSIQHLNLIHHKLIDATVIAAKQSKTINRTLPWPSFELPEEFPEVEFIDTEHGLIKTGIQMHNCLAAHVDSALYSSKFYFKLQTNKKAVMSVNKVSNEKWDIAEIKGYCNQIVDVQTAELADNWLAAINSNKSNNKGLPCLY